MISKNMDEFRGAIRTDDPRKKGAFLFSVTRTDYDYVASGTYDSFIACADTEVEASSMRPDGFSDDETSRKREDVWVSSEDASECLKVECIGIACYDMEKGVVLASFNAK